jgi:hypothetical protein
MESGFWTEGALFWRESTVHPGQQGTVHAGQKGAVYGSAALPFVIPSEAEGSAVQRTSRGNVFGRLGAQGFQAEKCRDHCIDVFEAVVKSERWADRGF